MSARSAQTEPHAGAGRGSIAICENIDIKNSALYDASGTHNHYRDPLLLGRKQRPMTALSHLRLGMYWPSTVIATLPGSRAMRSHQPTGETIMPKTVAPGRIAIPGIGEFVANAVPDPFDARDFPYRSRLQVLPSEMDQRAVKAQRVILEQRGNSCTGHAVAAVINTVLAQSRPQDERLRVSPYMLYHLARRYDEFPGEEDEGSSLRGAFKGWFHHGVVRDEDWSDDALPDLDDPAFIAQAGQFPLGAFYRVNPYRLDDVQSAITELAAIAVSGVIHEGWVNPTVVQRANGEQLHVIHRAIGARNLGGHAYTMVGYNEVGFLIQNSWGPGWGDNGFATLPYEDWLENAYDAWVARPGVPSTPFASGRVRAPEATGGVVVTAPGPDLRRLKAHVVNLGNNGRLSDRGRFVSTPQQVQGAFDHMRRWHEFWLERGTVTKRHIVVYVHGGLVGEEAGLALAHRQLNWWLNNGVYPLTLVWQSGAGESLLNQLSDLVGRRLPAGGLGFDLVEQFDRLVEKFARANLRWIWDEMKENARVAGHPGDQSGAGPAGGTLLVQLLADYVAEHGADAVEVHLVGHSAGSIVLAELLERLAERQLAVSTLALLAPAIRVDAFGRDVLPHIGEGKTVARFVTFAMTDQRELDDVCGQGNIAIYQKSLLYLVSRALERRRQGDEAARDAFEVPILGMQRFFDRSIDGDAGETLRAALERVGGRAVFAPASLPVDERSDSSSHGGFDDDRLTMTSVIMQMLRVADPAAVREFQPHAPLADAEHAPTAEPRVAAEPPAGEEAPRMAAAPGEPEQPTVETQPPGEVPVTETGTAAQGPPAAPSQDQLSLEVADAPVTGSPVLDVLLASGYEVVDDGAGVASEKRTP